MITRLTKFLLFAALLNPSYDALCQSTVDVRLIKHKKIKKIIKNEDLQSAADFQKIQSNCLNADDVAVSHHKKSYVFQFPLDIVWNAYLKTPPKTAWSAKLVSLGMMYESEHHSFYYQNEPMPTADVGQLVFINLHLLNGFFNVAVAHKIMEINPEAGLIRTCYVESGASEGTQFIRFYALGNNQTKVEHTTLYRSKSRFRDKYLYPFLHEKVITEFHRNINHNLILTEKSTVKRKPKNLAKLNNL